MGPNGKLAAKTAFAWMAADQLTKILARAFLPLCQVPGPRCVRLGLGEELGLVRVANGGSALGFGQGLGVWILIAVLGLVVVPAYARGRADPRLALAAGLQLGGAAGNLIDRLAFGAVTDFLQIGPVVMNLADLVLLIGTVLGAQVLWRSGLRTTMEEVKT